MRQPRSPPPLLRCWRAAGPDAGSATPRRPRSAGRHAAGDAASRRDAARPGDAAVGGHLGDRAAAAAHELRAARRRPGGRARRRADRVRLATGARRDGAARRLAARARRRAARTARPAGSARGAARLGATDVSIHVDRSRARLDAAARRRVSCGGCRSRSAGPATPTPLGRFAVTDRLRTSSAGSPYGCCALALSGHQTKLPPGWPGGDRLAIHGTPNDGDGRHAGVARLHARARARHAAR